MENLMLAFNVSVKAKKNARSRERIFLKPDPHEKPEHLNRYRTGKLIMFLD
jgi:hypothetical protein